MPMVPLLVPSSKSNGIDLFGMDHLARGARGGESDLARDARIHGRFAALPDRYGRASRGDGLKASPFVVSIASRCGHSYCLTRLKTLNHRLRR